MATTLVFAALLQAVATSALPNGNDLPTRPFGNLPAETLYATPMSCSVPATEDKACIS
jgi:hypothetical protein